MGWPKGTPRKGHVNKDGKPHAGKGERLQAIRSDPERYLGIMAVPAGRRVEKKQPIKVVASTTIHGATGRPVIEPCPDCSYAYADGGYCPECGWTTWKGRV